MQSSRDRPSAVGTDLPPVLAGVAFAVSGVGVALALTDAQSPLRAPFVIFFLFTGPACGLYAVLPGLDRVTRAATAATGSAGIDLAVAGAVSSLGIPMASGGIAMVAAITALLFLWSIGRRTGGLRLPSGVTVPSFGRNPRGNGSQGTGRSSGTERSK
ncbi:hypothetical protein ACFQ61_10760 [Streptomyces sp. NPDC056500]|uniref:hypothetical protein n=1 Tax=Streptomyces sp. NPDC056500 TaxID=3345840 RepID=UPI0036CA51CD